MTGTSSCHLTRIQSNDWIISMLSLDAILRFLGYLTGVFVVYGCYQVYTEVTSPLRNLPGPKPASWLFGNAVELLEAEDSLLPEQWAGEYDPTIKLTALFGTISVLHTMDTKALKHVIVNSDIYQKPAFWRYALRRLLGPGAAHVVEGDKHKHQNPVFGPSRVRELADIFIFKSIQLRDIWSATATNADGSGRVDALSWLRRAALDVVGLAGFNYDFDALSDNPKPKEVTPAFSTIKSREGFSMGVLSLLGKFYFDRPRFTDIIDVSHQPTELRPAFVKARHIMTSVGHQSLRESKAAMNEKHAAKPRDLLSLLVKSNTDKGVLDHRRLNDQEVLAEFSTFLVASNITIGVAAPWALYALTQNIEVQNKLREELLSVDTENPTMDQLNSLPYLDMVVRETMRIFPPMGMIPRVAHKDDVLPLNTPITDTKGVVHDTLRIYKGQYILIPILAVNRDKSIWGEDALEFRPERWQNIPEAAGKVPGVWGNMLTFSGGQRACLGYRFSLVQIKATLFTLIRAFEFELAVPVKDLVKKSLALPRPVLVTDREGGHQMPLLIRPVVKP
ncbi:cytochrome P450 [Lyophyllum atratum]|nr:cytochrome P450 [Lyophyllum atratum]